jgi:hypothetical protein
MPWHKLGLLYTPQAVHPRLATHAANPVPLRIGRSDRYRVLFNGRDLQNRSSVGWVEVDLTRMAVTDLCSTPLFVPGPADSFFADGISIGNVYEAGGRDYLPFMGWQSKAGRHWWGELGRFLVQDDGELRLDPEGVWIGLGEHGPLSLSYPWVMATPQGGYRMWYGSTSTWDAGNGEMLSVLHVGESSDGHAWVLGDAAIPYEVGKRQVFSRPTVAKLANGEYRMWFSTRSPGSAYRIGTARSTDLVAWDTAPDDIDVSASGWDSDMIAYPYVFWHDGRLLMLYNGNRYGGTGFGLADWA